MTDSQDPATRDLSSSTSSSADPESSGDGRGIDLTPPPGPAFGLDKGDLIDLFQTGDYEIEGRMADSSNATLLVVVSDPEAAGEHRRSHRAIYKPGSGERPLWDFPPNIYRREAAMFRLADHLGWDVVPPTTLAEGPFGEGSVQAFVNADFRHHYFSLHEDGIGGDDLRLLCALDIVANNTDRKSGHCLLGSDGRVYGIDHGLAFHAQFKLRTVMWDYIGEPLPQPVKDGLALLLDHGLPADVACLLDR
ncbi:MAG: hypothetical protein OER95_15795, partial [Acidimicrobiia bacterium]|nr:hypothetical protein [Acidimicrobiia bacterium]